MSESVEQDWWQLERTVNDMIGVLKANRLTYGCDFKDEEALMARLRAALSTPEQPSVDWLDPARESCLIDGVRYERIEGYEERWAYQRSDGEWTTISGFRAKALQDQIVRVLVPIDQHPEGEWIDTDLGLEYLRYPAARRPAPVEEEATDAESR